MTRDLRVTIVQTNLAWEDIGANLSSFGKRLDIIGQSASDLIVLPEMFNTGFTMNASAVAETMNGKTMEWMAKIAAQKNAVLTGSIVIKEDNKFYNRLIWMRPDSTYEFYDKRHTFRIAKENETYANGKSKIIVHLHGWRICPLICYDLRFPVWSRNTGDYDLLIYVANWPHKRGYAWRQLLIARAIENQSYVVGVNRIGTDAKEIYYDGYSMALDPKGELLSKIIPNIETVETVSLSYLELENYRKEFPVSLDADKFNIE